jgi:predicted ATP-grasp superfamily ATP-dependent carboligase
VKIFAYEHAGIECNGSRLPLSASGLRSDIMLKSLLSDISHIRHVDVTILRTQSRHAFSLPNSIQVRYIRPNQAESAIEECMQQADAVWPLAPESDGVLARISERVLYLGKILIGSKPAAVKLTGSKYATSLALARANVPVVNTYRLSDHLPDRISAWVVKPDDGAGCTNTYLFSGRGAALAWIAERGDQQYVLQPFIPGRHCSLSLICAEDRVMLLSLNEQRMVVSDNQLHHMGSTVNSIDDPNNAFATLARNVVAAIPGLWGYVGIDFIMAESGPIVLEVNPRMTTSHAGLHESMGCNPTETVIELAQSGKCRDLAPGKVRPISVDLNTFPEKHPGLAGGSTAY